MKVVTKVVICHSCGVRFNGTRLLTVFFFVGHSLWYTLCEMDHFL